MRTPSPRTRLSCRILPKQSLLNTPPIPPIQPTHPLNPPNPPPRRRTPYGAHPIRRAVRRAMNPRRVRSRLCALDGPLKTTMQWTSIMLNLYTRGFFAYLGGRKRERPSSLANLEAILRVTPSTLTRAQSEVLRILYINV